MSAGKQALGRGFSSLIPDDLLDDTFDPTASQDEKVSQLRYVPLDRIHADPDQPRRTFDKEALDELADSIREHGVLQPIIVTESDNGYQIVAGERRFRASTIAGIDTIPVLVRSLTNQHKLELSLIENLQRRDLNAIETATAYVKLRDQFNLSQDEIGRRVHKSPSAISNTMRLIRLPKKVQQAIADGRLTEGQARPLVGQDEAFIEQILPKIIAEDWSARKVEQYMINAKNSPQTHTKTTEPQHESTTVALKERLKTDVAIRVNGHGAGSIVIKFKDETDFERIQKLIS